MPDPQNVSKPRHGDPADRSRIVVRRTALLVAVLLVIALLAPFVAWQLVG